MRTLILIVICFCFHRAVFSQELQVELPRLVVHDRDSGYVLLSYQIPFDGYYDFRVDGGLFPKRSCTIYYCEYRLQLRTVGRAYLQKGSNIGSQAQDGRICHFDTHEKNNRIGGIFRKGEKVQLLLLIHKSDVNGEPHKPMAIAENSRVSVTQVVPVYDRK